MKEKNGVWILLLVLFLLIACFAYDLFMLIDYEQRKDSGNDRWKQVEERILRIENRVEELDNGRDC